MFKLNIIIALRSLVKQRFFTLINVFGLVIGITGSLLIALFIADELSYNTMFADADRIYRLDIDHRQGGETNYYASVSSPMGAVVEKDNPQIELMTRFRMVGSTLLHPKDVVKNGKEEGVVAADSNFLDMFGLSLAAGNPQAVLSSPNTMIVTKTVAKKYFGTTDVLGKVMVLNDTELYTITGVIDDLPTNSLLRDHNIFLSIVSFEDSKSNAWNGWSFPTFVKFKEGANLDDFQAYLDTVLENYLIPWAMTFMPGLTKEKMMEAQKASGDFMKFGTTALKDIHLRSEVRQNEYSPNSTIQNIYILAFIGIFLVLLACVNYINLSTAYSLKRVKEVGIRKTLGSDKLSLIRQFLTEAGLISLGSILVALPVTAYVLPYFNTLADKSLTMPFMSPLFWTVLGLSVLLLTLFSGFYPAFFMSRFVPAKVLKWSGKSSIGGSGIRNILVVAQFAIAIVLLISTIVVYRQLNYMQNKNLGFQKEQILVLEDIQALGNQVEAFKESIGQLTAVEQVSASSYLPTPSARSGVTFFPKDGVENPENALVIENWKVDYDYLATLDLKITAGRDFQKGFPTDSSAIIFNESAVRMMGIEPEEALGIKLTKDFHRPDKENMEFMTIVGVVKDFHFESLRDEIGALSLNISNTNTAERMMVKLNSGSVQKVLSQIETQWNDFVPNASFSYYFMDDSFNDVYRSEVRLRRVFMVFTLLSIFIACLGLFGLSAFNAEKKIKEIGIRKVMGASVHQIVYKLIIDFLKLVGVAILIA
ncbi:MAG: ABC transporter permease, partial [Croceivirga sp.]